MGIGNFGKVYKANNKKERRNCALKVLLKESVARMKQADHIISEREVLQYLKFKNEDLGNERCPFIMDIFSSFQDSENLYFELEYIEGCSLLS